MFQKDLLPAKRILITGGGTGLGKASAQRFLELGAEVYICGRRQDVLEASAQELNAISRAEDPLPSLRCTGCRAVEEDDRGHLGKRSSRRVHEQCRRKFPRPHGRAFPRERFNR